MLPTLSAQMWVLIVGASVATVFGAALSVGAWRRAEQTSGARPFAVVMVICTVWAGTDAVQFLASGAGRVGIATTAWTLGRAVLAFSPVAWFVFAAEYGNRPDLLDRRFVVPAIAVSSLFSLGHLTNGIHGVMWTTPTLVESGGFTLLGIDRGVGFWAQGAYSYALILAGSVVFFQLFVRSAHVSRKQVGTILLAGIPPTITSVVHLFRLSPVPGLDLTSLAFVVEGVIVYGALYRFEFLDLTPVARDAVVTDLQDGVVVVDDEGTVTDSNPAATTLASVQDPVGEAVETAFPSIGTVIDPGNDDVVTDGGQTVSRGVAVAGVEDTYVDVNRTPLRNHRDSPVGQALVLHEVTRRERRERRLTALQEAGRKLRDETSVDDVRQLAVETGQELAGVPFVAIYDRNEEGRLVPAEATDEFGALTNDEFPTFDPGEGLIGVAYENGEVVAFEDVHGDASAPDLEYPELPVRGAVIAPLGEFGVLAAGDRTPIEDEDIVRFFELLSTTTRAALKRASREEALRERERTLRRKNERLDQFASVVSHDIRNPLSIATSYLEEGRKTGDDEFFEEVAHSLERMDELTEDLLTLARQGDDVEEVAPVSLESTANDAWSNVSTASAELTVEDLTVLADRKRLQQVLENLVSNAIDHGDATHVTIGATDDGFYVADDGAGIPPEERERVFERGHTGGDGTGFGLAIVSDIAKAHDWTVTLTESESGGACFRMDGVERERPASHR